jgi:hypothetical protein
LRERVASEGGRVKGRADRNAATAKRLVAAFSFFNPSSVAFGDTFSRKGRRKP